MHHKTDAGEQGHGVAPCEMQHRGHWKQENLSAVQATEAANPRGARALPNNAWAWQWAGVLGCSQPFWLNSLWGQWSRGGSLGQCFGGSSLQPWLMTLAVALLYAGLCVSPPLWLPALQHSLLCSYQKRPPAQSHCQRGQCGSTVKSSGYWGKTRDPG